MALFLKALSLAAENLFIQVHAEAGLQRFARKYFESALRVSLSLRAQEQGTVQLLFETAVRKLVLMRHKKNFDVPFQQRANDLPRDLGTFPLVCRGEGVISLVNEAVSPTAVWQTPLPS